MKKIHFRFMMISIVILAFSLFLQSCNADSNIDKGTSLSQCINMINSEGHDHFFMTSKKTDESIVDYVVVNDGWLSKTVIVAEREKDEDTLSSIVVDVKRVNIKNVSWNISRIKIGKTTVDEVLKLIGPPTKSYGSGIRRMMYVDMFDGYLLSFDDSTGTVVNIQHNGSEYKKGDLAIDQIIVIVLFVVAVIVALIVVPRFVRKRKSK